MDVDKFIKDTIQNDLAVKQELPKVEKKEPEKPSPPREKEPDAESPLQEQPVQAPTHQAGTQEVSQGSDFKGVPQEPKTDIGPPEPMVEALPNPSIPEAPKERMGDGSGFEDRPFLQTSSTFFEPPAGPAPGLSGNAPEGPLKPRVPGMTQDTYRQPEAPQRGSEGLTEGAGGQPQRYLFDLEDVGPPETWTTSDYPEIQKPPMDYEIEWLPDTEAVKVGHLRKERSDLDERLAHMQEMFDLQMDEMVHRLDQGGLV